MNRAGFTPGRSNEMGSPLRVPRSGAKRVNKMKKKTEKQNSRSAPMEKAMELTDLVTGKTDPSGSYTGQPADPREKPVQDADDL